MRFLPALLIHSYPSPHLKVGEVPAGTPHPQLDHVPGQLLAQGRDLQELVVVFYELAQELEVLHEYGVPVLVGAGHDDLAVPAVVDVNWLCLSFLPYLSLLSFDFTLLSHLTFLCFFRAFSCINHLGFLAFLFDAYVVYFS